MSQQTGNKKLSVYAPASIGNMSVGFDALGLALAPIDGALLGDVVSVENLPAGEDDWRLDVTGPFAHALPPNPEDNIVTACCRAFSDTAARQGHEIQPLKLTLEKRLPIGSGLGSSASSVVAALEALNRFHAHLLSAPKLFGLMAEMEGAISGEIHLDNVAPCLYGGLRLCPPGSQQEYALPWPGAWRAVVCWPGTKLETRRARSVLPDQVERKTAVRHGAQFAQFVHALHSGDAQLAGQCVVDHIAEPYRRGLLPGFDEARVALREIGALAVGISGSGPTVFALVDDYDAAEQTARWLDGNYRQNDAGFVHICRADQGGARCID
ncbi:MAG: homoserine kinase [Xanthomonadales bacterium]|jgi:homoserine kinase|nr:homoserine kinase [Xanthomonadales bacterium]